MKGIVDAAEDSWETRQQNKAKALKRIRAFGCKRCNRSSGQFPLDEDGVCAPCREKEAAEVAAKPKHWGAF